MGKYTVEHVERGMLIRGPIPVSEIPDLVKIAEKKGWDIMDSLIPTKIPGVTFVMTNEENSIAWRRELGLYY